MADGKVPFLACAGEIMLGKSDNFGPARRLCFKEKLDSHRLSASSQTDVGFSG